MNAVHLPSCFLQGEGEMEFEEETMEDERVEGNGWPKDVYTGELGASRCAAPVEGNGF